MTADAPLVHAVPPDADPDARVRELIAAAADRAPGLHLFVRVGETGNMAQALLVTSARAAQHRWVQHARRGASPGGWSERKASSNKALARWRSSNEQALDRILIDHCKQAWRLQAEVPCVVEFAPLDLAECGIEPPPA
jgi:hypothetical protein